MNKNSLLTAGLAIALGAVALTPQAAKASDGTITINGRVTTASCTVKVNGGGNNATVTLPTVQSSDFTSAGTATGYTAVNLALSNCSAGSDTPAVTKVLPYFEAGPTIDVSSGYLLNSGTATGVEVMLSTSNTTASKLNLAGASGNQNAGTAQPLSGNPSFTYYAAYVSTAATVGAGTVATTVQYDLDYQ